MLLDAFGEQTFSAALPPPGQRGAAPFAPHPGTKTVLPFACALGCLISPFHKPDRRALTVKIRAALSTLLEPTSVKREWTPMYTNGILWTG